MLTSTQIDSLKRVTEMMRNGKYVLQANPCLCGITDDTTLALQDRLGIPIRTALCLKCGLVRSDPYYDEKTLSDFYSNEYRKLYTGNEKSSEKFFADQQGFGQYIYNFLVENLFKTGIKNKKVFEIGCGAGGILDTFQKYDNEVFGCDYGETYLKLGREKGLKLVTGGSSSLIKFGKADIVILNHTLEHMTRPREELAEIKNLLSPDGILYIAVPGIYSIHDTYKGKFVKGYLQNAHVWYFTLKTLTNLLVGYGYKPLVGNEIIQSVFRVGMSEKVVGKESPEQIQKYLKKIRLLRWYYELKKFSLRHTAFETLRLIKPLYSLTRYFYRKFKK